MYPEQRDRHMTKEGKKQRSLLIENDTENGEEVQSRIGVDGEDMGRRNLKPARE